MNLELVDAVGWTALLAGLVCLAMALVLSIRSTTEREETKKAIEESAKKAVETQQDDGKFKEQAGALSTSLEAVAKLAASLKDLDRVAQLLTVSLGFFAIAGVVAGLEQVAQAVAN